MKTDIHPKMNNVIFIDSSTGDEFVTKSTLTSKETKEVDGVTYYVVHLEVSSKSHPFYIANNSVDTQGRVDKFRKKWKWPKNFKKHAKTNKNTQQFNSGPRKLGL